MARDLTYFISDLHLGAACHADPRAQEQRVCRWLDLIAPTARRLYMLGDVMDYWWDYRTVVPRGHVRFLGSIARMADAGTEITWFKGNHDIWLFDYMQKELGVKIVDGAEIADIDGKRFFLEHGDGVGRLPASFRMLRALFRCRPLQVMYSAIHPRWTIPLAHAWSRHSRMQEREAGESAAHGDPVAPLAAFAREELQRDPSIDYFVFGHVHRAADIDLGAGHRLVVLGDWITHDTYAVFDGKELKLCKAHDRL